MTGVQLLREWCDKASRLPWRGALRQSMVQWRKCCLSPKDVVPSGGSALERCPQITTMCPWKGHSLQALGTLSWRNMPSSLWAPEHIHHETLHPWLPDNPDRCSEEGEHSRAEKCFPTAAVKRLVSQAPLHWPPPFASQLYSKGHRFLPVACFRAVVSWTLK